MCLAKDHNAVTLVSLEPESSWSRVKHSTTEPLHSLKHPSISKELTFNTRKTRWLLCIANLYESVLEKIYNLSLRPGKTQISLSGHLPLSSKMSCSVALRHGAVGWSAVYLIMNTHFLQCTQ